MIIVIKIIGSNHMLTGIPLVAVEIVVGALIYFMSLFILQDVMLKEAFIIIERKVKKNG